MAKYVVTLNGKNYEVEVEKNTATITNTTAAAAPANRFFTFAYAWHRAHFWLSLPPPHIG